MEIKYLKREKSEGLFLLEMLKLEWLFAKELCD